MLWQIPPLFFFCSVIGLKPRTLYILGKPFVTQWHLQNQMELKILIQFGTVWKKWTLSEIVAYLHLFFILIKVISCVLMFLSKQFFLFAGSFYDPCAYYYFTATLFLLHLSILRSTILSLLLYKIATLLVVSKFNFIILIKFIMFPT